MPRGKNYVNNNRGVTLQKSGKKKTKGAAGNSMVACEYGSGCTRPDCIYRHDGPGTDKIRKEDVCLPFLAGRCTFKKGGCRRRHPTDKAECERLLIKYKKTRCRFGDECHTEGCLYLHPAEIEEKEPNYIEPDAFPPLNACILVPKQTPLASAWRPNPTNTNTITNITRAPVVVPPEPSDDKASRPAPSSAPAKGQNQQHKKKKGQQQQQQQQQAPQKQLAPAPTPVPVEAPVWPAPPVQQQQQQQQQRQEEKEDPPQMSTEQEFPSDQMQYPPQNDQFPMYDMHMQMPPPFMGQPFAPGMVPPPYFDPSMSPFPSPQNGMMGPGYGGMEYAIGYTYPFQGSHQDHANGFNANAKEFVPGGY